MQVKKSPKASLEDKKFTYALIGFVFVLSVCFVALEWTEHEVKKFDVVDVFADIDEDLDIQQTTQETPPPPPPPEVKEIEAFQIVEDDKEVETVEVNSEVDDKEIVEIKPPVEIKEVAEEEEVIFVVVENMPEFPGGQEKLFRYLSENVKYPQICQENGIQGRSVCQFVVNKDGSIVDVVVVKSSGDEMLDKEAVRVIKSMPKWKPGKQRGQPVRVKYTVPVNFRLQ